MIYYIMNIDNLVYIYNIHLVSFLYLLYLKYYKFMYINHKNQDLFDQKSKQKH